MQLVPRPGARLGARSGCVRSMPVSTIAIRTGVPAVVTPAYPAWCAAHALVRRIPFGAISTACSVRETSTCATRGSRASAAAASGGPENANPSSTCEYTARSCPPSRPTSCGASRGASAPPTRVTIHVRAGEGAGPIGSTAAAAELAVPPPASATNITARSALRPALDHPLVRTESPPNGEGPAPCAVHVLISRDLEVRNPNLRQIAPFRVPRAVVAHAAVVHLVTTLDDERARH